MGRNVDFINDDNAMDVIKNLNNREKLVVLDTLIKQTRHSRCHHKQQAAAKAYMDTKYGKNSDFINVKENAYE